MSDEFNILTVDTVFNRGNKLRSSSGSEHEWKKSKEKQKINGRWGARSIYEDRKDIDPFNTNTNEPGKITGVPESTRRFELRF